MQRTILVIYCCLIGFSSIVAQDKYEIRQQKNPFSEARFSYFKETILLFNEYLSTKKGSFNTTNFRILKPIGYRAINLRFDAPLVSTTTNSKNKTGLGDLSFSISYIPFLTKKTGIASRIKLTTNSASDTNFGQGKWILSPAFFYGKYLDEQEKLLLLSDLEYQFSFAGSNNRNPIKTTVMESTLIYSFTKNWISCNMALRYNKTLKGFQNSTFVEFGRKLTPDSLFYIHPSLAFGEKKTYNQGIELGLILLY